MFIAWVLFPLVLMAVCLGCGLIVERVAGWHMPGALLPGTGLAVVIVAATLTTDRSATAKLTTPLVIALAILGYLSSWRRLRSLQPDGWTLALGLVVFAMCAAPVVVSGQATFLGYFQDTDQAFHLELVSWLMDHGRSVGGVYLYSNSAVPALLYEYINSMYPLGADVALGSVRPLIGQDLAWVLQPYMAMTMAFGGLAVNELLRGVVTSRPLRALCAFTAVMSGLAYAFYLQAGIKEVATTSLITMTVVMVVQTLSRPLRIRAIAPLAVVSLAGLDVVSITIVPWIGIPLAVYALIVLWRQRTALRHGVAWRTFLALGAAAIIVLALGSPILAGASTFASVAGSTLSTKGILGNLAAPLSKWQVLGIWPSGDFRFRPLSYQTPTYVLLWIALASAVVAIVWMLRRRAYGPLLLLISSGVSALYLLSRASPYAASKVLMIFSPVAVLTAMIGAVALRQQFRRVGSVGWALAAIIAGGVVWTDALGYHDSSVAPQTRLQDLATIGSRFAGQGPTFYDLWDTLPVYFLRQASPMIPNSFAGPVPLRPGVTARSATQLTATWDPNVLTLSEIEREHLLVLDRLPLTSRPPANFRLVYQDADYHVWRRTRSPQVLAHLSFGDGGPTPPAPASCGQVRRIAATARRDHARLAYVVRPSMPTLIPTEAAHTPAWSPQQASGDRSAYYLHLPQVTGSANGFVHVPRSGRYQVWVQGSLSRRLGFWVGRKFVGSVANQTGQGAQSEHVGSVELSAGTQPVQALRPAADLAPGDPVIGDLLGPVILTRSDEPPAVHEIAPARARTLCGRSLEWLEVVR